MSALPFMLLKNFSVARKRSGVPLGREPSLLAKQEATDYLMAGELKCTLRAAPCWLAARTTSSGTMKFAQLRGV